MADGSSLRFLREQARLPLEAAAEFLGASSIELLALEGQATVPDDLLSRVWRVYERNNRRKPEPVDDDCYVPGIDDAGPPPHGFEDPR